MWNVMRSQNPFAALVQPVCKMITFTSSNHKSMPPLKGEWPSSVHFNLEP